MRANQFEFGVQKSQTQSNYDFNLFSILSAHHFFHHYGHSAH